MHLVKHLSTYLSHAGLGEDTTEEVSGIQHLTSDSDSEVYCDSMEQFGQEEVKSFYRPLHSIRGKDTISYYRSYIGFTNLTGSVGYFPPLEIYLDIISIFVELQFLEISASKSDPSKHHFHLSEVACGSLLETAGLLEPGNYNPESIREAAVEGKGEVKCGGEDGKASDGGPHKEKRGGEKVDFYGMRRGRGTVRIFLPPIKHV